MTFGGQRSARADGLAVATYAFSTARVGSTLLGRALLVLVPCLIPFLNSLTEDPRFRIRFGSRLPNSSRITTRMMIICVGLPINPSTDPSLQKPVTSSPISPRINPPGSPPAYQTPPPRPTPQQNNQPQTSNEEPGTSNQERPPPPATTLPPAPRATIPQP